MPKIVFLPHQDFCPEGMVVDAAPGENLLDVARIMQAWKFIMPVMALVLVPLAMLLFERI